MRRMTTAAVVAVLAAWACAAGPTTSSQPTTQKRDYHAICVQNKGEMYQLAPPLFKTEAAAKCLLGKTNSDAFCGFAPGEILCTWAGAEQTAGGWKLYKFAFQATQYGKKFPSADFGAVLRPQRLEGQ